MIGGGLSNFVAPPSESATVTLSVAPTATGTASSSATELPESIVFVLERERELRGQLGRQARLYQEVSWKADKKGAELKILRQQMLDFPEECCEEVENRATQLYFEYTMFLEKGRAIVETLVKKIADLQGAVVSTTSEIGNIDFSEWRPNWEGVADAETASQSQRL
eukprot:Trichotokara_eunicae@DN4240_c0_g1_i1.p1